jgi:uncharacterized DUF497 family protein
MRYEWDETKREENLRKHGVDFADAVGALEDPANLTIEDPDAAGEARFLTLGMDFLARVLLVVWTERAADCIRIISARKASPGETRRYHGA